jgi:flagellar biogenesis protein FliO
MELNDALRIVGSLAVIGALLLALQLLGRAGVRRRLNLAGSGRLLTIVETAHLPGAASLHVVKIGHAYAVVGRSAGYVGKVADVEPESVAAWLEAQERPVLPKSALESFAARLVRKRH